MCERHAEGLLSEYWCVEAIAKLLEQKPGVSGKSVAFSPEKVVPLTEPPADLYEWLDGRGECLRFDVEEKGDGSLQLAKQFVNLARLNACKRMVKTAHSCHPCAKVWVDVL